MDIDHSQLNLINKSKKYQNHSKKLKIDIAKDANNYITSFGNVPGYVVLKSFKEIFNLNTSHSPLPPVASAQL